MKDSDARKFTVEDLFAEKKLEQWVVDQAFREGRGMAVDKICMLLLQEVQARPALKAKGKTALARNGYTVPDNKINIAIMQLLARMKEDTDHPSDVMMALLGRQLGVAAGLFDKAEDDPRWPFAKVYAALLIAGAEKYTLRPVAAKAGVSQTALSQWLEQDEFNQRIKDLKAEGKVQVDRSITRLLDDKRQLDRSKALHAEIVEKYIRAWGQGEKV